MPVGGALAALSSIIMDSRRRYSRKGYEMEKGVAARATRTHEKREPPPIPFKYS